MSGIIGQDPRGRSGILGQFTDVGLNTSLDSEWHSSMNAIQINSGSLSAHDAYPHYVQLNANAIQKDSGEKRVNNSYKASQHRQWDGEHVFKVAPAASGDISWVTGMTINNAGDIFSTAFTDYSATSTITGFSAYSNKYIFYKRVGFTIHVWFFFIGTSNANTFQFTVPYTVKNSTGYVPGCTLSFAKDGGSDTDFGMTSGMVRAFASYNTNVVRLDRSGSATGWTTSGDKGAAGAITFQADSI